MKLFRALQRWWNPGFGYNCNASGVVDYLRACGHFDAARDVEALFRDTSLRQFVKGGSVMASPWHKYDNINTMTQKGQKAANDTAPKKTAGKGRKG